MKEIKLSNGAVIKMRKPKVRDLRAVADIENEIEKEMKLIGNLTNSPCTKCHSRPTL